MAASSDAAFSVSTQKAAIIWRHLNTVRSRAWNQIRYSRENNTKNETIFFLQFVATAQRAYIAAGKPHRAHIIHYEVTGRVAIVVRDAAINRTYGRAMFDYFQIRAMRQPQILGCIEQSRALRQSGETDR